jgi:hypothetical protein
MLNESSAKRNTSHLKIIAASLQIQEPTEKKLHNFNASIYFRNIYLFNFYVF